MAKARALYSDKNQAALNRSLVDALKISNRLSRINSADGSTVAVMVAAMNLIERLRRLGASTGEE